jgi:hypothetical protein
VQLVLRSLERFEDERPLLRRQPPLDDEHAVPVEERVERPALALRLGAKILVGRHGAAERAHEPLDVGGGAGAGHGEQLVLGHRTGDPRHRADLAVRQLPARKGCAQRRQRRERVGDPHVLARRPEVEADAPVEELRARAKAGPVPVAARVVGGDELEEPRRGRAQVGGQRRDLVIAKPTAWMPSVMKVISPSGFRRASASKPAT